MGIIRLNGRWGADHAFVDSDYKARKKFGLSDVIRTMDDVQRLADHKLVNRVYEGIAGAIIGAGQEGKQHTVESAAASRLANQQMAAAGSGMAAGAGGAPKVAYGEGEKQTVGTMKGPAGKWTAGPAVVQPWGPREKERARIEKQTGKILNRRLDKRIAERSKAAGEVWSDVADEDMDAALASLPQITSSGIPEELVILARTGRYRGIKVPSWVQEKVSNDVKEYSKAGVPFKNVIGKPVDPSKEEQLKMAAGVIPDPNEILMQQMAMQQGTAAPQTPVPTAATPTAGPSAQTSQSFQEMFGEGVPRDVDKIVALAGEPGRTQPELQTLIQAAQDNAIPTGILDHISGRHKKRAAKRVINAYKASMQYRPKPLKPPQPISPDKIALARKYMADAAAKEYKLQRRKDRDARLAAGGRGGGGAGAYKRGMEAAKLASLFAKRSAEIGKINVDAATKRDRLLLDDTKMKLEAELRREGMESNERRALLNLLAKTNSKIDDIQDKIDLTTETEEQRAREADNAGKESGPGIRERKNIKVKVLKKKKARAEESKKKVTSWAQKKAE